MEVAESRVSCRVPPESIAYRGKLGKMSHGQLENGKYWRGVTMDVGVNVHGVEAAHHLMHEDIRLRVLTQLALR